MSKPPPLLLQLPPAALERIISLSLSDGTSPLVWLSELGSLISDTTKRVLAATLTLPDDDAILVRIEQVLERSPDVQRPDLVTLVATTHSHLVRHLEVVAPVPRSHVLELEEVEGEETSQLDERAFSNLLERFPNLCSFVWKSHRLPPEDVCLDLARSAKSLSAFTIDLAPSPTNLIRDPSSPSIEPSSSFLPSSPGSPSSLSHHAPHSTATAPLPLRWDCPSLSSLPGTLTSLSLSSLSQAGIREFSTSLSSFFALENLEISKTIFVDDHLMREISFGLSKSLKRLTIREMSGTKLSDQGLSDLLEGCGELEDFEMIAVEGRLSKSCWSKIETFPPRLRSVKFVYYESPPHKSWVLDHLQSIPHLVSSVATLDSFTMSRRLHPESLVPGSHHVARHPVDSLLVPRKIRSQELDAITGQSENLDSGAKHGRQTGGKRWRELNLDLVLVDSDALKKLLESCTEVRRLQVCFDNDFKHLLSLSSSFSACLHLQAFSVSIPLEHTPELQSLTPSTYIVPTSSRSISLAAGSPSPKSHSTPLPQLSPSTSPTKTLSDLAPSNEGPSLPECIQSLLPPTRDWRRFLKKGSHSLRTISWSGRGGIGTFEFSKIEGKSLIRVEFEPTRPLAALEGGEWDWSCAAPRRARERQESWTSTFSSSSSASTTVSTLFGGPGEANAHVATTSSTRRRTASTSSVTTSGWSPTTPTKPLGRAGGGGGGRRKYGSIDAAFSSSCSPPAPPSSTTSIAAQRNEESQPGEQIGSGWSGFHSPIPTTSIPENNLDVSPSGTQVVDPFCDPARHNERGGGLELKLGAACRPDDVVKGAGSPPDQAHAVTTPTASNPWSRVPPSVTSALPSTPARGGGIGSILSRAPAIASDANAKNKHAKNGTDDVEKLSLSSRRHTGATNKSDGASRGGPSSSRMSRGSEGSRSSSSGQSGGGGGAIASPASASSARGALDKKEEVNDSRRKKSGNRGSGASDAKLGRQGKKGGAKV